MGKGNLFLKMVWVMNKQKIIYYMAGIIAILLFLILILYTKMEQMEAKLKLMEYDQQDMFVFSEEK
jgi:hypothetical protein